MSFAPGEAYQFDWSHETITLQNLPLTIKAAHMKLSHSRMPFVRGYFRETQELRPRQGVPVLWWGLPARRLMRARWSPRRLLGKEGLQKLRQLAQFHNQPPPRSAVQRATQIRDQGGTAPGGTLKAFLPEGGGSAPASGASLLPPSPGGSGRTRRPP
jgi:hypothetical protein